MLHVTHAHAAWIAACKSALEAPEIDENPIEAVQLARLASAVLDKSPEDLLAIAENNPMIIWEWIEAFRERKLKAEAEARYWAAAMATLSTAIPEALRSGEE